MSAERLREAARVLRERAEAATPGPWELLADEVETASGEGGDTYMQSVDGDAVVWRFADEPSADYIATVAPPFALAVADWLDCEAHLLDGQAKYPDLHTPPNMGRFALMEAVANTILGADS